MRPYPSTWVKVTLADVAIVQTGLSKSGNRQGESVSRPYLRVANVQDGYLDLREVKYIDVPAGQLERFRLHPGDVLLTEGGDFDKLGRGCLWNGEIEECVHQNHVFAVRVADENRLTSAFFALVIKSERARAYFISCAKQTTNLASINSSQIKQLPMMLPPLGVQREIVRLVDEFELGIGLAENLLFALQQRKQALTQQLLTGRRRLKGFKAKWKMTRADQLFDDIAQRSQLNEQLLSVTQDRGVIPRTMLVGRVTMPSGDVNSFKLVEPDNFVISLRSFQGGLEHSAYRGLVSPAYTVLEVDADKVHAPYFRQYFKSVNFLHRLSVAVVGIRDGKQISYTDFKSIKLPLPPLPEQEAIATLLNFADSEIGLAVQRAELLRTQKRALMQKLLSGNWRMPKTALLKEFSA
jgi:type I restriction enzyme, S subunit